MPRLLSLCARPHGLFFASLIFLLAIPAFAQDASTGAIRGTVVDSSGRRIVDASIALVDEAQGFRYFVTSDSQGQFVFELLPPGEYSARAVAPDMSPQLTPKLHRGRDYRDRVQAAGRRSQRDGHGFRRAPHGRNPIQRRVIADRQTGH